MSDLACENCGEKIAPRCAAHILDHVFCSRECHSISLRRVVPLDEAHDLYVNGMTLKTIGTRYGVCGEVIRNRFIAAGFPLRSRGYMMFGEANPTRGKGHTPETRSKLRKAAVRQFSDPQARLRASSTQIQVMESGKVRKVSKVEDTVAIVLDSLGVRHQRQAGIRCPTTGKFVACVDFLLNSTLVLEVNGTYWHSDPRFYPDGPRTNSQRHTMGRYIQKTRHLSAMGISVLEVWEHDVKFDAKMAVERAVQGYV